MTNYDIVALIPASGNSKEVFKKNIRSLRSRPLLSYVINAAKRAPSVQQVFVSTDDKEIEEVAIRYGAIVVPQDGSENSKKNKTKYDLSRESYLLSSLNELEKRDHKPKLIVFLQATSPFTVSQDIENAIKQFKAEKSDSLLSVCEGSGGFLCGGFDWNEKKESVNYDYKKRKPRQKYPKKFRENGALYLFTAKGLKKNKNRLHGKVGMYVMPKSRSFELDSMEDWELAESYMGAHLQKFPLLGKEKLQKIKILFLDFDGVLTDDKVVVNQYGLESVKCHRGDGLGLNMLKKFGVEVIVVSKEKNKVVLERCKKLKVLCFNKIDNKKAVIIRETLKRGLKKENVCFVGNDMNDLEAMQISGLSIAPKNAVETIKNIADYVTESKGGEGAVREVCDLLISSRIK